MTNDNRPLIIEAKLYEPNKTILTGQGVIAVGTVLGVVTASGKLKVTNKANSDGSEVAEYVLTKSVDTTAADVTGVDVLKMGKVNGAKLIFGGASVLADHVRQLADKGIAAVTPSANLENLDN